MHLKPLNKNSKNLKKWESTFNLAYIHPNSLNQELTPTTERGVVGDEAGASCSSREEGSAKETKTRATRTAKHTNEGTSKGHRSWVKALLMEKFETIWANKSYWITTQSIK